MRNAVSLLPERYKQQNKRTETLSTAVRAVVVVMICLVLVAGVTFFIKATLNSKLNSLMNQNDEARATILQNSTYEQLLNEKNQIATKINAVRKLDKKWIASIYDVSKILPDGVGFSSLNSSSAEGSDLTLTLDCTCNTLDDISKTLTAFSESPAVSSVNCTSTRISNDGMAFTLAVVLSGATSAEVVTEGGAQ